ncbi:MAG: hypothetical protein A3A33_01320 [Candidatus Yanofskybacteria bacterium RIFCSPLOWO2_01_FULL_49_25]|uniref:Cation-transporting P-type ATPase N-terminal domain-containing protein n=1 Tax=Candidatus Yanofskybacteria bacterium RIFCSPLOWO2_01_FULL_49_25 TaxID=1802701 RepID=A0A1F8GX03_9BACT|nr:MAG: hypothetical protein A3A33_01320 [Candidatus Yanofskybacteria bacterium RIFCSPLOWO2_01_FULL_49_25]
MNFELEPIPWFSPGEEVLRKLQTTPNGITEEQARARLKFFGGNHFKNREKATIASLFLMQFASPLIFILIAAAVLTGLLREWIEMAVIVLAVGVNIGLGFYREYHAEHTLEKLASYIKDRSRVIRGGVEQELDSELLVPGDIIKLSYGSRVPADARILSLQNIRIDEAILTGESVPVGKVLDTVAGSTPVADRVNMAHAGTLVVEGFATAVVTATGNATEIGKIASVVLATHRVKTPIQKGVTSLSWLIFAIVSVIVGLIFLLGISRGASTIEMLILSAAVAVGAVPEALPIALTVILAIGAERIAARKGIVRKLAAAETLGSTTIIMSDKTGTLTKADMRLVEIYPVTEPDQRHILELAVYNIDVFVENPHDPEDTWKFSGRPFEVNIAKACVKRAISLKRILENKSFLRIPFNSTNKFSVAYDDSRYIVMGAPDVLLKRSTMAKDEYVRLEEWIQKTSSEGKRILAVGTFDDHGTAHITPDAVENISLQGMLVFFDPIREEVPDAIRNIESHGVRLVIVTGDLKGTAVAVARSLGWHVADDEVLSGIDIHGMNDQELRAIMSRIKIFARVTPEDKMRIGTLYRSLGETVAMTGDGVNDAPALKAMDIGVALGSGSDVAKSAADLVLLDDNFRTISMAIDEGRRILANVRKAFIYLMSNSLDEVFVIGGSLLFNLPLPISALQIIWVNLFTGSLPALAFAFDDDFDHGIHGISIKQKLLTPEVKLFTFGIGILSSLLLFMLYYMLLWLGVDLAIARSVFFVCFSSYILVIAFSFRSLYRPLFSYPVFSNMKLNIGVMVGIALLVMTMTVPFIRDIFHITPMPAQWLWFVAAWLIFNIALVEGAKWRLRYRKHSVYA